ncbi:hypothetical protein [Nocardioides sp.]
MSGQLRTMDDLWRLAAAGVIDEEICVLCRVEAWERGESSSGSV